MVCVICDTLLRLDELGESCIGGHMHRLVLGVHLYVLVLLKTAA